MKNLTDLLTRRQTESIKNCTVKGIFLIKIIPYSGKKFVKLH